MIPQIIVIVLLVAMLSQSFYNHGKPKEGKHNFWITLLAIVTELAILYWGGFFHN